MRRRKTLNKICSRYGDVLKEMNECSTAPATEERQTSYKNDSKYTVLATENSEAIASTVY